MADASKDTQQWDTTDDTVLQDAFLHRLSLTNLARRQLVLKGSFLTRQWAHPDIERSAVDLDFEAIYPFSIEETKKLIEECLIQHVDDGITLEFVSCSQARADWPVLESHSCHAVLQSKGQELAIDFRWGDPMWPPAHFFKYKALNLLAVRPETQFGWKCAALFKRNTFVGGESAQGPWQPKDLWDLCIMIRKCQMNPVLLTASINVAFYSLSTPAQPLDPRLMVHFLHQKLGQNRQSVRLWRQYRQESPQSDAMPDHVCSAVEEVASFLNPVLSQLPQVVADRQFPTAWAVFGKDSEKRKLLQNVAVWTCPQQSHAYLVADTGSLPPSLVRGSRVQLGRHLGTFQVQSIQPAKEWGEIGEGWSLKSDMGFRLVLEPAPSFEAHRSALFLVSGTDDNPQAKGLPASTKKSKTPTAQTNTKTENQDGEKKMAVKEHGLRAQNVMQSAKPVAPPRRVGRRMIYVISSSDQKVGEFQSFFVRYGIAVARVDPYGFRTHGASIQTVSQCLRPLAEQLLSMGDGKSFWTKAVMWEQVLLLKWHKRKKEDVSSSDYNKSPEDGERALVRANLIVWHWDMTSTAKKEELRSAGLQHVEGKPTHVHDSEDVPVQAKVTVDFLSNEVEGYIDLSKKRSAADAAVFGFDDIFVVKATNLSYHEKKLSGCKCSPRDANLSHYVSAHVHYQTRKQWSHLAGIDATHKRTIPIGVDDGMTCANFIQNTGLFNNGVATVLLPCFYTVVNDGAFFRSAISRREVNYWCPGLNAGIPFTKKRDVIHEVVFLAHDFGHFMIPDLVFTGVDSPQLRRVYIVARMLSEATTVVFADMLFAEALKRSGVQYDWTKRAVWPLFDALDIDPFPDPPDIEVTLKRFREILHANAVYCLLGDDSEYRKMLFRARSTKSEEEEPPVLQHFKNKYMPFFVEDFRWTSHNYGNMRHRSDEFRRWWKLVSPLRDALSSSEGGSRMETVAEFAEAIGATSGSDLDGKELMERALDRLFETRLAPAFRADPKPADPGIVRRNALGRYMIGQLNLVSRFPFLTESRIYGKKLLFVLLKSLGQAGGASNSQCVAARGLFDQYVDVLEEKGLITEDDASMYKEICPLFEPCYVNYYRGLSFSDMLSDVQQAILGEESSVSSSVEAENILASRGRLPFVAVLEQVEFIDTARLWLAAARAPLVSRLRELLELVGVQFWDGHGGWFVKRPVAAVCALGGLPVSLDAESLQSGRIKIAGESHRVADLAQSWREGMGLASMPCYMNPSNKSPSEMWEVLCEHGHFSVGHTASLSFLVAGFSCGVENELNSQRDVVHLARITVARTAAQQQPPLVVHHASLLPIVEDIRDTAMRSLAEAAAARGSAKKADWHEAANLLWPAAKAQCAVLTGSLRGFQKLVSAILDDGKEAEYRSLLLLINGNLHAMLPEMFKANSAYSYKPPPHFERGD